MIFNLAKKNKILIASCTKEKDQAKTLLNRSLLDNPPLLCDKNFVLNNKNGLSYAYNKIIDAQINHYDFIVFIHDDVYLDCINLADKLERAKNELKYDIIGVAGTTMPKITHPALWHIMGERSNHKGFAGHIAPDGSKYMTSFGPTPSRATIIDGLFIAINCNAVKRTGWRFNENFEFHHYDISSCIDANRLKMRIGVIPIMLFHKSPGLASIDQPDWAESNKKFLSIYS